MFIYFNGRLPFPPLGTICVAKHNVRSVLSPHVLAPRELKNREKVWSDVISAPQITPWVIQSACKKKGKKKVNTNTWNENISPQSHTHTAVCQSRKDWQPKPSWWCPMSLKGSRGGLSTFNTTLKGKWKEFCCSFSPVVLSCLWLLFFPETSAETAPDLRLLKLHGFSAGFSIFPLSPLCLQAEGWQGFHCVLSWVHSAFPFKHWADHGDHLHLNLTQLLPTELPATADSIPPHSREHLLCPHQGYDCTRKGILCKTCVPASGKIQLLCLLALALEWGFQQTPWEPIPADYGADQHDFFALCGRPQVLLSVAV